MSFTYNKNSTFTLGAVSGTEQTAISGENMLQSSLTPNLAKAGTLTTRTDNDTGTITMTDGGHGITTGAIVDLYWSGGQRRNVTVGTVAGTAVPIDLGEGDNLPIATTAINACVVVGQPFAATGDDVKAAVASFTGGDGTAYCQVSFMEANVVVGSFVIAPGRGVSWDTGSGVTNPLAGDAVDEIQVSYGGTATAPVIKVGIMYD